MHSLIIIANHIFVQNGVSLRQATPGNNEWMDLLICETAIYAYSFDKKENMKRRLDENSVLPLRLPSPKIAKPKLINKDIM
jgi:hypothetical protein